MEVNGEGSCRKDAWRDEASEPRLNAKELHECSNGEENGPPSRTRAKIKRKNIDTVVDDSDSTKTKQVASPIYLFYLLFTSGAPCRYFSIFCITTILGKLQPRFCPGSFEYESLRVQDHTL